MYVLSAGVGSQFLSIATGILLMAMLGMFNVHHHGSINTAAVVLYALTSCVAGYVAANVYKKMGGDNWVWNINLTSAIFARKSLASAQYDCHALIHIASSVCSSPPPCFEAVDVLFLLSVPFFLVWAFVNTIAWAYGSTQALPWGTVMLLASMWGFCEFDLAIFLRARIRCSPNN